MQLAKNNPKSKIDSYRNNPHSKRHAFFKKISAERVFLIIVQYLGELHNPVKILKRLSMYYVIYPYIPTCTILLKM